jgi:PDZ domain-containing protein
MTEEDNDTPVGLVPGPASPPVDSPPGTGAEDRPPPPLDVPPGSGPGAPPPAADKRRRWWPWAIFIVLVVAIAVASRWNLNYYAVTPGTAQSVQQFITVPADKGHPVTHPVLLTDVEIGRVTALDYLFYKLQSNVSLDQVDSVTGGTAPAQLNAQGNLEMSQAEVYAKTSALRRLGYKVTATPSGAVIAGTFPGTPAYPVLDVGDVVSAVDGTPTLTADAVTAALRHYHSGQTIVLTVRKGGTAPPAPESITLKNTTINVGETKPLTLDLGIEVEDQVDYSFPFPVNIDVTNIGGPSAGLAMTLGVIDALTPGSLTGGHTVAATGTMDSQGNVGDVGGVPQKTIAVENAGASIFLVPPQEYKAAMSKDRPSLKIYAVSTLDQALAVLAAHGGVVPPAPVASGGSPTSSG